MRCHPRTSQLNARNNVCKSTGVLQLLPVTLILGSDGTNDREATVISICPALPRTIDPDLTAAVAYAQADKAAATRKAYATDFRLFEAWCQAARVSALPALPETVAAYLAHGARSGYRASTLGRRVAAIRYAGLALRPRSVEADPSDMTSDREPSEPEANLTPAEVYERTAEKRRARWAERERKLKEPANHRPSVFGEESK